MNGECSKKATMFSVLSIDLEDSAISMHETLRSAIKQLSDEGIAASELLDPSKYEFYLARDSHILRVSSATLCRSMGNLFREEGIGCDI
jgi:hypothetical protein